MLRRLALVRTDVSEERSASIIGVTRNGKLGTLAKPATDARYVCCWLLSTENYSGDVLGPRTVEYLNIRE
jgi:hypothetical protein